MKAKIFGLLILMESLFLFITFCVSLYYNQMEGDKDTSAFGITTVIAFAVGIGFYLYGQYHDNGKFSRKDSFLVVALAWVIFSIFGMLPFLIYGTCTDLASAFFETMSGFTTTGATVLNDIDAQPHGILFWRSLTHWLGGLGIVVFSFALIPVYELKNTNMFSAEVTGLSVDKLSPKIGDTARRLLIIYFLMTCACTFFFSLGPMSLFDAVCHALSTISTGGFGTHQSSLAFFNSQYIEYVASVFMILSGVNFSLYYYYSIGRSKVFYKNEELKWYLGFVMGGTLFFVLLFYSVQWFTSGAQTVDILPHSLEETFRTSLFHVSTIITTTGFQASNFDYVAWGSAFWIPTLILMITGACAGSTSGGVKIIRILVCVKDAINEFKLQLHPRAVIPVRFSGNVLPESKVLRALAFLFLYFLLVIVGSMALTLMGFDMHTAFGSVVSALSNVGPGMGDTGPAFNYAVVPAAGKWLLSILMLIGRLEIFTVLFLFLPDFWKQKI